MYIKKADDKFQFFRQILFELFQNKDCKCMSVVITGYKIFLYVVRFLNIFKRILSP